MTLQKALAHQERLATNGIASAVSIAVFGTTDADHIYTVAHTGILPKILSPAVGNIPVPVQNACITADELNEIRY